MDNKAIAAELIKLATTFVGAKDVEIPTDHVFACSVPNEDDSGLYGFVVTKDGKIYATHLGAAPGKTPGTDWQRGWVMNSGEVATFSRLIKEYQKTLNTLLKYMAK